MVAREVWDFSEPFNSDALDELIVNNLMKYTQSIGNVNELKCLIGFIELGYDVM